MMNLSACRGKITYFVGALIQRDLEAERKQTEENDFDIEREII